MSPSGTGNPFDAFKDGVGRIRETAFDATGGKRDSATGKAERGTDVLGPLGDTAYALTGGDFDRGQQDRRKELTGTIVLVNETTGQWLSSGKELVTGTVEGGQKRNYAPMRGGRRPDRPEILDDWEALRKADPERRARLQALEKQSKAEYKAELERTRRELDDKLYALYRELMALPAEERRRQLEQPDEHFKPLLKRRNTSKILPALKRYENPPKPGPDAHWRVTPGGDAVTLTHVVSGEFLTLDPAVQTVTTSDRTIAATPAITCTGDADDACRWIVVRDGDDILLKNKKTRGWLFQPVGWQAAHVTTETSEDVQSARRDRTLRWIITEP
ncbi:hypothetical protein AB0K09_23035 [Streptomyces sp. NPDC049577]|uniref:hypothetical protein n=1 Tax=Streptomyces sp. NPDC049577 TaxID=3155153 RepID=UPI00341947EF